VEVEGNIPPDYTGVQLDEGFGVGSRQAREVGSSPGKLACFLSASPPLPSAQKTNEADKTKLTHHQNQVEVLCWLVSKALR
jgi:hypothetical protein